MDGAAPASLVPPDVIQALVRRAQATPAGAWVEVGVYQGGSAWHLAEAAKVQSRRLYLYDTFTGIPWKDTIDSHEIGDFAVDTSLQQVRRAVPYAICVPGIFPASALEMGTIAFVHLDCDQYQSYAQALDYLAPRMAKGGVAWCDDVPCLAGASEAVREFTQARGLELVPVTDVCHHKAFIQF